MTKDNIDDPERGEVRLLRLIRRAAAWRRPPSGRARNRLSDPAAATRAAQRHPAPASFLAARLALAVPGPAARLLRDLGAGRATAPPSCSTPTTCRASPCSAALPLLLGAGPDLRHHRRRHRPLGRLRHGPGRGRHGARSCRPSRRPRPALALAAGPGRGRARRACVPGLINGTLISRLKVPPFIGTLGMYGVARGAGFLAANGTTVPVNNSCFCSRSATAGSSACRCPVVITVVLVLVMHWVLSQTRFGQHTYAIGGNRTAALRAGINVRRHTLLLYMISRRLRRRRRHGLHRPLLGRRRPGAASRCCSNSIAAVVIGGASLFGGSGTDHRHGHRRPDHRRHPVRPRLHQRRAVLAVRGRRHRHHRLGADRPDPQTRLTGGGRARRTDGRADPRAAHELTKRFGGVHALERRQLRAAPRRGAGAGRRQRRRQVDPDQGDLGRLPAGRGRDLLQGRAGRPSPTRATPASAASRPSTRTWRWPTISTSARTSSSAASRCRRALRLPARASTAARMREAARDVLATLDIDIDRRKLRLPVRNLSGGQRQAVAIGRAIYWNAELLIMDEPTAALGVPEQRKVRRADPSACKRRDVAVIFISHNLPGHLRRRRPHPGPAPRHQGRRAATGARRAATRS